MKCVCYMNHDQSKEGIKHNNVGWHRKKKAVHKTTSTDDKRLQNTLKRLGVNTIPGIEEVNIFLESDLINFTNPKGAHDDVGNDRIVWRVGGATMIHAI